MYRFFICALTLFTVFPSVCWAEAGTVLDQRIGRTIPGDLVFFDETGAKIRFGEWIDKPTVFAPVYLTCPHTCPLILNALADALAGTKWIVPGRDFQVVALSFNERDTPVAALEKKKNYISAIGKPFPDGAWKFLTGDKRNIQRFLDAAGYQIAPNGMDFAHPAAIFVVSPKRQIARYLHGVNYAPFDLEMAINEAAQGRLGTATSRVLSYCFTYDAAKRSYVFNILKAGGAVMAVALLGFLAFLLLGSRKGKVICKQ